MREKSGLTAVAALVLGVFACSEDNATPALDASSSGALPGDAATEASAPAAALDGGSAADAGTGVPSRMDAAAAQDTGLVTPDGGAVDAATDAAAIDGATGDAGSAAFQACVAGLKACRYDDKETACSSVKTPVIPLTNGMKWGDTELPQGPYGSYVEWNEGMAFANPVNAGEATCEILAPLAFNEPQSVTDDVLNLRGQELSLYTVFRPACMRDDETYPVITWGNGTCGQSGGYAGLLATLASHGFVVFAANSRFTDGGNNEMLKALDLAKASNEDPKSPLFGKLDFSRVGAMGHSQGANATAHAAPDPRIKAVILWNGGDTTTVTKPFMTVSGDRDTSNRTVEQLTTKVNASTQPAAWVFFHQVLQTGGTSTGHLVLMMQPERVAAMTIAWWKYILNGDAEAKKTFAGADCGLCKQAAAFEYGQKNIQ